MMRPRTRERLEAGLKIGCAHELEHDIHAAGLRERARLGSEVDERVAVRAAVGEHARAGGGAELDGGGADSARRAVHEERLSHGEAGAGEHRIVSGDERLRDGGRLAIGEVVGDARNVALVHGDRVGETASADQPEDAVAGAPCGHGLAARDHGACDLEARDVGGRAGRCGIVPGPLDEIGGVQACMRDAHQHLRGQRHRIGPLADGHHLRATRTKERDGDHRLA